MGEFHRVPEKMQLSSVGCMPSFLCLPSPRTPAASGSHCRLQALALGRHGVGYTALLSLATLPTRVRGAQAAGRCPTGPQQAEPHHRAFLPIRRSLYLFSIWCQDEEMHACTDHRAPVAVAHGVVEHSAVSPC